MCNHEYEKNTKKASLRVGACALVFVQRGERAQLRDHPPNLELIKAQLSARPTAPPFSHEKCVLYNQEQRKRGN